jgi:hypothetical protein
LKAAREGCTAEMRALAKKEDITAVNAYVEPIEVRLTPVTDMSVTRLPVPVMLGTGLADTTLVPRRQYAAVKAFCAEGSDLVWKTFPGATHNGGLNASFPDALAFFRDALAGRKAIALLSSSRVSRWRHRRRFRSMIEESSVRLAKRSEPIVGRKNCSGGHGAKARSLPNLPRFALFRARPNQISVARRGDHCVRMMELDG